MADRGGPSIYSIAAHRGFADALVAGLVPRYSEPGFGLARLTLLLPSARTARTVTEAFVRHFGEAGEGGMLMPRMALVGDLDLDETLGALLDPLGSDDIPPAGDPTYRWLRLAQLIGEERSDRDWPAAACLRIAREMAATMDRLAVEDVAPEALLSNRVLDEHAKLAEHAQRSLALFARVQLRWKDELARRGEIDAAARRNLLFERAAQSWRRNPPPTPIVAAGVTSAAPALARLLRVIADLPDGAVILPDLDLTMDDEAWAELGRAGAISEAGDTPFGAGDAVTHPQYHLKLLLERMGIARGEVRPWHRRGLAAAEPERSHAIASLFLPPEASKRWALLESEKRRLAGVRLMESAHPEEEAQAIALLVREALEQPEKRVAVVTPDRGLARRVVHHLHRWNIEADDSAGRPLGQTPAGRVLLALLEVAAEDAAPQPLMALLQHPLVRSGEQRRDWLRNVRRLELALRGPRRDTGLEPLAALAAENGIADWWSEVAAVLAPLLLGPDTARPLDGMLGLLSSTGEALCGEELWAREDGRALAAFAEELGRNAALTGTMLTPRELLQVLRDAMEQVAVRPSWGGHPRVAIYGLLESRMARAELMICAGLNEGSWPAAPAPDPLLAPPVLRALGVPGAEFRIGLAAHDLAGALGAPEVVLSRAARDISGPAIPSRFLLRARALMGEALAREHAETHAVELARALGQAPRGEPYPVPSPKPSAQQRKVGISVTSLDRLNSDAYQFYASSILQLKELDLLDAAPSDAWKGQLAHKILETWWRDGEGRRPITEVATEVLQAMDGHPLTRALWLPRLLKGLEWVEIELKAQPGRRPVLVEEWGAITHRGVRIYGKADRIDQLADGTLAVVDYKTGEAPKGSQIKAGYALQLGTIALMAERGGFDGLKGRASRFEYWSLKKDDKSDTGFGKISSAVYDGKNRSEIQPDTFVAHTLHKLDEAFDRWILGEEGFTARLNPDAKVYNSFDQLMRLDEWMGRE